MHINAPIESQLANVKQSLNMAQHLSAHCDVKVIVNCRLNNNVMSLVASILGTSARFRVLSSSNKIRYYYFLIKYIFSREYPVFYSRSMIFSLLNKIVNPASIVELHQHRFSNNKLFDYIMIRILSILNIRNLFMVCISEKLKSIYVKKGIKQVIYVLHDAFIEMPAPKKFYSDSNLVLYTGKVSLERSFEDMCFLASINIDLKFLIVGCDFDELEFYRKIARSYSSNIKVYSKQKSARVSLLQNNASILLALWGDQVPTMEYCSPLKIFEYMSTGNKILCHNYKVLHEVLPQNLHVSLCEPEKRSSLASKFKQLLELQFDANEKTRMIEHSKEYTYKRRASKLFSIISK